MSNGNKQSSISVISALLLALGIACAGYFISETVYKSKVALNTAQVKGLAERRVKADTAYWTIQYKVSGTSKSNIKQMYRQSESDQKIIIQLLNQSGFSSDEIKPGVIDYRAQEFRDENQKLVDTNYFLTGKIDVETDKVRLVSKVRAKLNALIAQGLDIQNQEPSYYFTKLNNIKPAMLKEATQNARLAANEFAINAGVKVGGIRNASQGSFIVRDVGQSYGDSRKIEKDVRVVTSVTFFLTD
ncbi:SIMPL domain-containing protein [Parashewanella curva]|uniref:SIMPL domain-containing protein n=1 Tax=Parashewanella curva TaxID=2338552 RepID=A0A3L8PWA6_9GAMM|nr:SIMPL domain-containing protein [Parashewanella curva]RLV59636.1 SIMPL domain-containing protein [Parashewanella curva]